MNLRERGEKGYRLSRDLDDEEGSLKERVQREKF